MEEMLSFFSRKPTSRPELMEKEWRKISWSHGQNNDIKERLRKPRDGLIKCLRILVIGPANAGKSSFIHSIKSVLKNKIVNAARTVSAGPESFTKNYKIEKFKDDTGRPLPFVIGDVMGLENGENSGVHLDDIINILQGHIKENYKFNSSQPCSKDDPRYNTEPTLQDKIHCVAFIIPIDNLTDYSSSETNLLPSPDLIKKMQTIREAASNLNIPQVAVLTKIDIACDHVKKDIKQVYRSQAIHQKAHLCSTTLGIPMRCMFPVKNYSDENGLDVLNPDVNDVLLFALAHILGFAHDFVDGMMKGGEFNSLNSWMLNYN